jgi:sulfatase maturation enzyme AslB (radical SAM superfamily)
MFTNGIGIDRAKAKWLHDHRVCLILKLDTFEEATFDRILGKNGTARKIYKAVEFLLSAGYGKNCEDECTDLAFSIVPVSLTINQLDDVIKFAGENHIFPSIGELEQAGRALDKKTYGELAISHTEALLLRQKVEKLLWEGYMRPICPTIITGLHIDNVGNCIVDRETGLNCKWFLLTEPMPHMIGNVRKDGLKSMHEAVRAYRKACFDANGEGIRKCESVEYIFGGCGGSPKSIVSLARQHL